MKLKDMAWIRLASLAEFPPGALGERRSGAATVAICNDQGVIHAFHGECPHLHGPLAQGNLAGGNLIGPWHGWEFSCASGEADHNSAVTLKRYPVEIRGGDIYADLD